MVGGDDQGRPQGPHEEEEHRGRQHGPDDQVMKEGIAGFADDVGLIVELPDLGARRQKVLTPASSRSMPRTTSIVLALGLLADDERHGRQTVAVDRVVPRHAAGSHRRRYP